MRPAASMFQETTFERWRWPPPPDVLLLPRTIGRERRRLQWLVTLSVTGDSGDRQTRSASRFS